MSKKVDDIGDQWNVESGNLQSTHASTINRQKQNVKSPSFESSYRESCWLSKLQITFLLWKLIKGCTWGLIAENYVANSKQGKPKTDESEIPHRTNLTPTRIYLSGIQSNLARPGQPCMEHGLAPNWTIPSSALCGLESQIWDRLTTRPGSHQNNTLATTTGHPTSLFGNYSFREKIRDWFTQHNFICHEYRQTYLRI